jgi:hypothetical protein
MAITRLHLRDRFGNADYLDLPGLAGHPSLPSQSLSVRSAFIVPEDPVGG